MVTWEVVATLSPPGLFPHLLKVGAALVAMCSDVVFLRDTLLSLQRAAIGYAAGCIIGILFGVATATMPFLGTSIGPVLRWARSLPPIALAPFLILLVGLGEGSKLILIAFGVLFPVWIATHTGLGEVSEKLVWAARSLGASRRQVVRLVLVPASTPFILGGRRTAIEVAFTCLVGAEIAGATGGLMYRIEVYRLTFLTDRVVAGLVLLGCLGAGADWLFVRVSKRLSPGIFGGAQLATVRRGARRG